MKKTLLFIILLLILAGCGEKYPFTSDKEKYEITIATFQEDDEIAKKNYDKYREIISELKKLEETGDKKAIEERENWQNIVNKVMDERFPYTNSREKLSFAEDLLSDNRTVYDEAYREYREIRYELEKRAYEGEEKAKHELKIWDLILMTKKLEKAKADNSFNTSSSEKPIETATGTKELEKAAADGNKDAAEYLKFLKESGFLKK